MNIMTMNLRESEEYYLSKTNETTKYLKDLEEINQTIYMKIENEIKIEIVTESSCYKKEMRVLKIFIIRNID